jgi:hypothetical protein
MINWPENKTTTMMTTLIIPQPTTDPDPGQCHAPHILLGTQLSQAAVFKSRKIDLKKNCRHSINFKLLRQT